MREKISFREKQNALHKHKLDMDVAWAIHRSEVYTMTDVDLGHEDMDKLIFYLMKKGILSDEIERDT